MATETYKTDSDKPEYVCEDDLGEKGARKAGRALDLYAQEKGYHSFAEFAASTFKEGLMIYCDVREAVMHIYDGDFFQTKKEMIEAYGFDETPVSRQRQSYAIEAIFRPVSA